MTVCSDETGQEGVTGRAARVQGTQLVGLQHTFPWVASAQPGPGGRRLRAPQTRAWGPALSLWPGDLAVSLSSLGLGFSLSRPQGPGRPVVMCPHSCLLLLSPSGVRTGSAISRPGTWRMSE